MKRFLTMMAVFAIIMVLCDVLVGFVGNKLIVHAKGGETERENYIANSAREDVLILGSSRAFYHYDPEVFQDVLGMSAYNCGFSGMGIICEYGYFEMITERYFPKVFVYEVFPQTDLLSYGGGNIKYLGSLKYFYDRPGVNAIFRDVDKTEYIKMLSRMYRFNSKFTMLIMDNLHPLRGFRNGFSPLRGEITEPKPAEKIDQYGYDSLKLDYLERIVTECEGNTLLVFAVSPMYENKDDSVLEPLKALCEKYDVPLLNHSTDDEFNFQREYFKDRVHLNAHGAAVYSEIIAGEIQDLLTSRVGNVQ